MLKSLRLQIDRSTWNVAPLAYRKMCPFFPTENEANVDFIGALLWTGITSVSIRLPRWWLASQWAIVRYVAAADHTIRDLRLHAAVDDLDTHHKMVLSDDWGVGLALQWLATRMEYKYVVHGAFAMDSLRNKKIAQFIKRGKRGPSKCPDFFAVDVQNKIHLIECKGNQAGSAHIDKQFQRGRQQKRNVRFEDESLVGQRLLTGIAIAGPTSKWLSMLRVADPTPNEEVSYYEIKGDNPVLVIEAFKSVIIAQGLIAAGAFKIANSLFPRETETEGPRLLNEPSGTPFTARNKSWMGQIYELAFPIPIELEDRSTITSCRMRVGAEDGFLDKLKTQSGQRRKEDFVRQTALDLSVHSESGSVHREDAVRQPPKPSQKERTGRYAAIQHGDALIADLELLEG